MQTISIMPKLSNDSTSTFKGINYQFLIALKKCFELKEGEVLYIEKFGDVSIIGSESEQIECKYYQSDLTDADINVWKTLKNWINEEFPLDTYNSLVLLTTQNIKYSSNWYGWNDKNKKERITILETIYASYKRKKKKSKETEDIFEFVLNQNNRIRLLAIIEKFVIDNNAPGDLEYFKLIKDEYAKSISPLRKDSFIHSLLGFVIDPKVIQNNWEVTFEDFSKEVESLTQSIVDKTTQFPLKVKLDDIQREDYLGNIFVEKIHQIDYDEVIGKAVNNYVQTKAQLIQEITLTRAISKSYKEYEDNIIENHETKYRFACRNCPEDLKIHHSKNFYDNMMQSDSQTFHTYSSVPEYFHNGVLHILADDEELNIVWLLK